MKLRTKELAIDVCSEMSPLGAQSIFSIFNMLRAVYSIKGHYGAIMMVMNADSSVDSPSWWMKVCLNSIRSKSGTGTWNVRYSVVAIHHKPSQLLNSLLFSSQSLSVNLQLYGARDPQISTGGTYNRPTTLIGI